MTILALILLAAVALAPLAFLALRRPPAARGRREAALGLHRAQLAELERDRAEGRIGAAEHATALVEVQRRLLAADALPEAGASRAARAPLLAALVLVPAAGAALYLVNGRPDLPSAPLAARVAAAQQTNELVGMLRQRLETPGLDPERKRQGYILLGNTQDATGDLAGAAAAWRQAVRLRFDPGLAALAAEAQTRVDGRVGADAAALFARALAEGPKDAPWRSIAEQRVQQASAAQ